jgi:adenosylcobinamide-phosphate synthase
VSLTLSILLGVLLDRLFGEVPRWHPLVGFGRCAAWLEKRANIGSAGILCGAASWALLVLPAPLIAAWLSRFGHSWLMNGLALYFALGARALHEHGGDVALALQHGDMEEARRRTGFLVSRETANMDEEQIARATTESLLENGNDAIFAAIFWCAVAGAPGVILYRLANTLDAMWGYRNARFERFGKVAARIDDALNLIPARLTALTYALLGKTRLAFSSWRAQAGSWSSPNAGPVMAAGAGALGLQLGGAAIYEGSVEERPTLGSGQPAKAHDIHRALALISRSLLLWLAVLGLGDSIAHLL